jgi:hypothetical protein
MKKLISVIIIGTMVFGTSAVAFATGNGQNGLNPNKGPVIEKMKNGAATPAALTAEFAELQALRADIKANHEVLFDLRQEIKASRLEIKTVLESLRDNKENLTEDQIAELKLILADLKLIRTDRKAIHDGRIKEQAQILKGARANRDFAAAITAMTNIIAEQDSRKIELADINDRLQDILAALKAI